MADPVIVELAVNGPTPRSRNPSVPRTPEEIAEQALPGITRGAAIVHNHNDETDVHPSAAAAACGSGWRTTPGPTPRPTPPSSASPPR